MARAAHPTSGELERLLRQGIEVKKSWFLADGFPFSEKLTGAERREWMGMGVAGIIINMYCGSFPHSLLSTSKKKT